MYSFLWKFRLRHKIRVLLREGTHGVRTTTILLATSHARDQVKLLSLCCVIHHRFVQGLIVRKILKDLCIVFVNET